MFCSIWRMPRSNNGQWMPPRLTCCGCIEFEEKDERMEKFVEEIEVIKMYVENALSCLDEMACSLKGKAKSCPTKFLTPYLNASVTYRNQLLKNWKKTLKPGVKLQELLFSESDVYYENYGLNDDDELLDAFYEFVKYANIATEKMFRIKKELKEYLGVIRSMKYFVQLFGLF